MRSVRNIDGKEGFAWNTAQNTFGIAMCTAHVPGIAVQWPFYGHYHGRKNAFNP